MATLPELLSDLINAISLRIIEGKEIVKQAILKGGGAINPDGTPTFPQLVDGVDSLSQKVVRSVMKQLPDASGDVSFPPGALGAVSYEQLLDATNAATDALTLAQSELQQQIDGLDDTKADKIEVADEIDRVEAIARGRTRAQVFDTFSDMDDWLNVPGNTDELQVGDHLYIREQDVPDYWWDGEEALELEATKVDLSDYATLTNLSTGLATKEPVITEAGGDLSQQQLQYYDGTKGWRQLASSVFSLALSGLSTATSTVIDGSTTLLDALGRLQAQITLRAPLASPSLTGIPTTPTPQTSSPGNTVANKEYVDAVAGGIVSTVVVDNLASTSTTAALSANQGRVLSEGKANTSHTHAKADVGLGNVDNTTDAAKPISTATQTALNLKADLASPVFTGTPNIPSKTTAAANNGVLIASEAQVYTAAQAAATAQTTASQAQTTASAAQSVAGAASTAAGAAQTTASSAQTTANNAIPKSDISQATGGTLPVARGGTGVATLAAGYVKSNGTSAFTSVASIAKADVGLGSVDNTADTAKPVSTAQQTALNLKANLASPTFTGTVSIPSKTTAATSSGTLVASEAQVYLKANIASPTFTGTVSIPSKTTAATSSGTLVASEAQVYLKANTESPTFTGTPAAPTASLGTNSTQIATTAFVQGVIEIPTMITVNNFNVNTFACNRRLSVNFTYNITGAPTGLASGQYYGVLTCEASNGWTLGADVGVFQTLSIPKLKRTYYRWVTNNGSTWTYDAWGYLYYSG